MASSRWTRQVDGTHPGAARRQSRHLSIADSGVSGQSLRRHIWWRVAGVVVGIGLMIAPTARRFVPLVPPDSGSTIVDLLVSFIGAISALSGLVGLVDLLIRRQPPRYPTAGSSQDQAQIDQLQAAYGRVRRALRPMPSGRERNQIISVLAGARSGDVALQIVTSRAWSDPWLGEHRLELDPLYEATAIYDCLARVARQVTEFSFALSVARDCSEIVDRYAICPPDVTAELNAVEERARALRDYAAEVSRLSDVLMVEDLSTPQRKTLAEFDPGEERGQQHRAARGLRRREREVRMIVSGLHDLRSMTNETVAPPEDGSEPTAKRWR